MSNQRPLPKIGAPATRALGDIGVTDLGGVRAVGLAHLGTLHGVGPKAIEVLRVALEQE